METSNYNIALEKAFDDLMQKDFKTAAEDTRTIYDQETNRFTVTYLNEDYIVDPTKRVVIRISGRSNVDILDAILIVQYLSFYQQPVVPFGKWVSLKELPNGGNLFYPAFYYDSIGKLKRVFGANLESFGEASALYEGRKGDVGDAAYVFDAFPLVPICIAVWEEDEDFPANATVLFDLSVSHLLHIESIIGLGDQLVKKLISREK